MRFPLLARLVSTFAVLTVSGASAQKLSIVEGPGLGAPARHGLEKFEAVARSRGWQIEKSSSVADASSHDAIVCVGLARQFTIGRLHPNSRTCWTLRKRSQ